MEDEKLNRYYFAVKHLDDTEQEVTYRKKTLSEAWLAIAADYGNCSKKISLLEADNLPS